MSGINKVFLIGHLGKDPDFRKIAGDVAVATFPIATTEYIYRNGVKTELTDWHNIIMWRNLADAAIKMLKKGKLVYIEGKVRTRSFEDSSGVKRYVTEIVSEHFTILTSNDQLEKAEKESFIIIPETI